MVCYAIHLQWGNQIMYILPSKKVYTEGKVPLEAKKREDIQKIIQYVPTEFSEFYESFRQWPTSENGPDSDIECEDDQDGD
jgi:hypothetical protein